VTDRLVVTGRISGGFSTGNAELPAQMAWNQASTRALLSFNFGTKGPVGLDTGEAGERPALARSVRACKR
jgi:hypothetical protein